MRNSIFPSSNCCTDGRGGGEEFKNILKNVGLIYIYLPICFLREETGQSKGVNMKDNIINCLY